MPEVPYLGHIVSGSGIRIAGSRVAEIAGIRPPASGKQVQAFLGMVNFLRSFIPCLATLAAPLDALRTLKSIDTDDPDVWTPKCQTAFDAIKESIKAAPLLARPMWQEKFLSLLMLPMWG